MSASSRVSIVIPVYNAEGTIGGILDTLLSQPYTDIEVIVVNDGSRDGSLAILERYASNDKRVVLIDQPNGGVSSARNAGLHVMTGDYVMFIDSDDKVTSHIVTDFTNSYEGSVDMVVSGVIIGGVSMVSPFRIYRGDAVIRRYVLKSLLMSNILYSPWCKMFRARIVKDNNITFPADVRYGEDTIFVLNYIKHTGSIVNIDKAPYIYSYDSDGLGSTGRKRLADRRRRRETLKSFTSRGGVSLVDYILSRLVIARWAMSYIKSYVVTGGGRA